MSYKSLERIYQEQCASKQVTPLSRHTINEYYQVKLTSDNDTVEKDISSDLYDSFKRQLIKHTQFAEIGGTKMSIGSALATILTELGWDKDEFQVRVKSVFDTVDMHAEKVTDWYQSIKNKPSKIIDFIADDSEFFLYEVMSPEFIAVCGGPRQAKIVFDRLYDISGKISGKGIGAGELVLTLAGNARKGSLGDLKILDQEVEIKGTKGRLEGSSFTSEGAVAEINAALTNNVNTIHIKKLWSVLLTKTEALADKIEKQITANKKKKIDTQFLQQGVTALDALKAQILGARDVPTVTTMIQQIRSSYFPPRKNNKGEDIDDALQLQIWFDKIVSAGQPTYVSSYSNTVNAFFSVVDEITYDTFVKGVVGMRSYPMYEDVDTIYAAITQLIPQTQYKSFKNNEQKKKALVAALHLACYAHGHSFTHILFANDETKKAVSFKVQKAFSQNLINAYTFFLSHKFQITLNIDGKFGKAASITLT